MITTHNPFNGKKESEAHLESLGQVKDKLNELKNAQIKWQACTIVERVEAVSKALRYFEENRDLIAEDICRHMGRPLHQATGEISGMLDRANYMCSIAKETLQPEIIEDSDSFYRAIVHAPLGTVFVVSAWNYPLLVTVNSVVPALLAGNTVLLKHSSTTPTIGEHFARAFSTLAEISPLVNEIKVSHDVTGQIIEQLKIDHVVFTGSVNGGKTIAQHCAQQMLAPHLELGGKDGAYVASDANLQTAAETLVDGAMFNSGQSCCGIERVYVDKDIEDDFIKLCTKLIENYELGDPTKPTTNLGPLAHAQSVDLMLSQIQDAVTAGATLITGGRDLRIESGRFLLPTLLRGVNSQMSIMRDENFGPILPIQSVSGIDEAIREINASDYGLTSAIFTTDSEKARQFCELADTGTVFVNRCDYLDPALPWTGVRNSGRGSALSKYGLLGLTRRKAIHNKHK